MRDLKQLWTALDRQLTVEEGAALVLHAFVMCPSKAVRAIDSHGLSLVYMRRIPGPTVKYSAQREVPMAVNELVEIITDEMMKAERQGQEWTTDDPPPSDRRTRTLLYLLHNAPDLAEKIFDAVWPAPGPGSS